MDWEGDIGNTGGDTIHSNEQFIFQAIVCTPSSNSDKVVFPDEGSKYLSPLVPLQTEIKLYFEYGIQIYICDHSTKYRTQNTYTP